MEGFGVLVILSVWISVAVSDKSFGQDYGDYAISYMGLEPLHSKDNEYIDYDGELTIIDKRWRDKMLSGDCTIKKKLGPLGMKIQYYQKPKGGNQDMKPAAMPPMTIDNACESSFGLEYFEQRFTRTDGEDKPALNFEECTIDPGEYRVSNWTIEPHMKKGVGERFPYGTWGFEITLFGNEDDGEVEYVTIMMKLQILNKKAREHQRKVKGKGNKKHNENEPDHPDADEMPEQEDFDPDSAPEKFGSKFG